MNSNGILILFYGAFFLLVNCVKEEGGDATKINSLGTRKAQMTNKL